MRRTRPVIISLAAVAMFITGCSSKPSADTSSKAVAANSPAASTAPTEVATATTAFQAVAQTVTSAKLTSTVTADNDPNHLLGRPNQYTSKVTFSDSRVSKSDASGYKAGDVELGGAVEVFATASDAAARATYIKTVTKSMPALTEYDFVHGTVLVRVSHYLTPKQAADYDKAVADPD